MTGQQLQAIKERAQSLLDDGIVLFRQDIEAQLSLVAEVERLRKEVHGHEQSLLHDTYSEFTAKREIERLREALTAVNSTIGTYLKAYHYPVYEQMSKLLEEGEGNEV